MESKKYIDKEIENKEKEYFCRRVLCKCDEIHILFIPPGASRKVIHKYISPRAF